MISVREIVIVAHARSLLPHRPASAPPHRRYVLGREPFFCFRLPIFLHLFLQRWRFVYFVGPKTVHKHALASVFLSNYTAGQRAQTKRATHSSVGECLFFGPAPPSLACGAKALGPNLLT